MGWTREVQATENPTGLDTSLLTLMILSVLQAYSTGLQYTIKCHLIKGMKFFNSPKLLKATINFQINYLARKVVPSPENSVRGKIIPIHSLHRLN